MKKLIGFMALFSIMFFSCTNVFADVQPSNLIFIPEAGGYYIYSNNIEAIERENLLDISNANSAYLMNNDNLESSQYTIFVSHLNHTELYNSDNSIKELGFDIEVDVEFKAKTDVNITLGPIGFETSTPKTAYKDGSMYRYQDTWNFLNALATYKQMPIYTINSDVKYFPQTTETKQFTLKAGQSVWLSEFIDNYSSVSYLSGVFMMGNFTINQGICDVNVAALKSTGRLKDRSQHNPNAARGIYYNDKQQKGIANSKAAVTAEVNYVIDDSVADGTKLPVKIYNQYNPDGIVTDTWVTNINPQGDIWVKNTAAESDMLQFTYYDESKKNFYGSSVPLNERDNFWIFDVFHSDTREYKGEPFIEPQNFVPNYKLPIDTDNIERACNLGNFGVAENYKVTIKNYGTYDRYFNYNLETSSPNVVVLKDENNNPIYDYAMCKGQTQDNTKDILASVLIPKGEEKTFIVEVTLPTNALGGMKNSFEISDTVHNNEFYDSTSTEIENKHKNTGREYYTWNNNSLFISADFSNWQGKFIDEKTKSIFYNNWDNYDIKYTDNGYMVRWNAYDGALGWYIPVLLYHNDVYFLDNDFNLESSYDFDSYVTDMSYAKGIYYVKTMNKTYYSYDKEIWYETNSNIPVYNNGQYCFFMYNNEVFASTDGLNYKKVSYAEDKPKFIAKTGNLYYYTLNNSVFLSNDGIYWKLLKIDDKIKSVYKINNNILINDSILMEIPEMDKNVTVVLNDEILGFDKIPEIQNGRILVPMRYMFEKLGAEVTWNEETRTASMQKGDKIISFQIDSNNVDVNGNKKYMDTPAIQKYQRTLIPLRFFSEELGLNVNWNEDLKLVTVSSIN